MESRKQKGTGCVYFELVQVSIGDRLLSLLKFGFHLECQCLGLAAVYLGINVH